MKIGFTGTRHGMTDAQKERVEALLSKHVFQPEISELHHGDCVGADADAHAIAWSLPGYRLVVHPPVDEHHRAFCERFHQMREPLTHFARNRNIVDGTDCLIACPFEAEEQPRGGTWYTVRYARKKGKHVYLVLPDGTERLEREEGGGAKS